MVLLRKNETIMSCFGNKYLLLFMAVLILSSCSPEAGRKTLNFFFDGVPSKEVAEQSNDVDSLIKIDSALTNLNVPEKSQIIYHIPYLEKECASCHDQTSMGNLVMPQPRLCYQCHENFEQIYNVVHGPVGGGYCTECHQPHYTKEKYLLRLSGQELCFQCHVTGVTFNTTIHEGIEDTNCTECHNPHGGEDSLMFN